MWKCTAVKREKNNKNTKCEPKYILSSFFFMFLLFWFIKLSCSTDFICYSKNVSAHLDWRNIGCAFVSLQGVVGRKGWAAAVSLRFVCRKSTHCTSFRKVTHTPLCPCHLSLQPHISTQNKGEPGCRDGNRAPAFYCPFGLWMNIGPLMIRPAEVVAIVPHTYTQQRGQTA